MSAAENKELAHRYFNERWNQGNLNVCDELLSPSVDIEAQKEFIREMLATFGNLHLKILDLLAEGDQVAVHWRIDGTHQGEFQGVFSTGRPVTFQGIALLRIADGKIVDDVAYWDNQAIRDQLEVELPSRQTAD